MPSWPRPRDSGRSPKDGNLYGLSNLGSEALSGLKTVCVRHPTRAQICEPTGYFGFFDSVTLKK